MTQQDRQFKKVKLYRVLKVVFYCLGLPLFVAAVFLASIRFIGNDPFTGNTDFSTQLGFFDDINKTFTSPALYGVWIALAIWVVIAIVHIILAKTVKSRRVRTLSVTAFTMVAMLVSLFTMDAVLGAKIEKIADEAPSTVTVQDYKTLLSYYRTITSGAHSKNLTENLISQVELMEKVYNVQMEGFDKTGTAGSIANKPATYFDIISDKGDVGVDISFKTDTQTGLASLDYTGSNGNYTFTGKDGIDRDIEGKNIIRLAPDGSGNLTINGQTYSHYFVKERTSVTGGTLYTWYMKDMEPTGWTPNGTSRTDGIYGEAFYSQNGLLSDGWVFSLQNVVEILEDYYEAKEAIENGDPTYYADAYADMYEAAWQRRDDYYNSRLIDKDKNVIKVDPWLTALYNQEVYLSERFSLTRGELDELIAKVGALLGDNKLFDYLLGNIDDLTDSIGVSSVIGGVGFLGGSLGNFLKKLNNGMGLSEFGLDKATLATVTEILGLLTGKTYNYVDDIILTVSYKAPDCYEIKHDNLYLALVRGVGEWQYADGTAVPVTRTGEDSWVYTDGNAPFETTTSNDKTYDKDGNEVKFVILPGANRNSDIILDIDFNDEVIGSENIFDQINGTDTYAFDFDTLSAFLNRGLNNLLDNYKISLTDGTVGTILNLVKTLGLLKTIDVDGEDYIGLVISGIEIPLINSDGQIDLDINGILDGLLKNWYSYQSSVIKPVWEFYVNPRYQDQETNPIRIAQENYAKYERALYLGKIYGSMIGSTLIGDNLGSGAYPSSLGLTDLASVQQLKVDLSYQPECFPLFAVRDMIALFTGLVVMFYFISFIAAQREEDYATGKLTVRDRKAEKAEKEAKKHESEVIKEFDGKDVASTTADSDAVEQKGDGKDDASSETQSEQSESAEQDVNEQSEQNPAQETQSAQEDTQVPNDEPKGESPDVPVEEESDEEVL